MSKIYAVILSGGTGTRLGGDIPKQYLQVNNRSVLSYVEETIFANKQIEGAVIVCAAEYRQDIQKEIDGLGINSRGLNILFADPGATRQLSIVSGMEELGRSCDMKGAKVLIHDAARPLLSEAMLQEIFKALEGHDGVLPVLPMKDTVYFSEDGTSVSQLIDRSKVFAGQAPELFDYEKYLAANLSLSKEQMLRINGSTEPAIMGGMDITMIPGDENNFKITTKADLERFLSCFSK